MYYRYKTRKNNTSYVKVIFIVTIIVVSIYFLYSKRGYLELLNYSENKVVNKITQAQSASKQTRGEAIKAAIASADKYLKDNPFNSEAFFLAGSADFLDGENELSYDYSGMLLRDSFIVPDSAKSKFIASIKKIRQAVAYTDTKSMPDEYIVMLAKSYFYTGYYSPEEIYGYINKIDNPDSIARSDDRTFYCIMLLKQGRDEGLMLLKKMITENDVHGHMVLAGAYQEAKQYTNAIVEYKKLLQSMKDDEMLRIANMNIGRIYYTQSLYKEALLHLETLILDTETDPKLRSIMEKCYIETGDKIKSKRFAPVSQNIIGINK